MDENGRPQDENLAEAAREQNSNLRRLIDGIGALIVASRELLGRLQTLGEGNARVEDQPGRSETAKPPVENEPPTKDEN